LKAIQKLLRAHAGTDKLPSKIPSAYEGKRRVIVQKISVDWLAVASPASEPIPAGTMLSVDDVVREFVSAGVMTIPGGDENSKSMVRGTDNRQLRQLYSSHFG
jgi:hypothetical protein